MTFKIIIIGGSTGSVKVLSSIVEKLPKEIILPIVIITHTSPNNTSLLPDLLQNKTERSVLQCEPNMPIEANKIYIAPPNYHLYLEPTRYFSLSTDPHVGFSRPSIDLFFESVADSFGPETIAILLTGANADGAMGIEYIQKMGGITIVQSPDTAESPIAPHAALQKITPDYVIPDTDIISVIQDIHNRRFINRSFLKNDFT